MENGSGFAPLDAQAVPGVVRLFEQQLLPDEMAEVREYEQRAEQLALHQVDVLDLLGLQHGFTIIGGAGTGKTGLARKRLQDAEVWQPPELAAD